MTDQITPPALPAYPTADASAPTPLGADAGSSSAPTTPPTAPSSTPEPDASTPAAVVDRKPVGATIEFDTFDAVTGAPLRGFGLVRGYVEDVDAAGNPTGPVLTKVTVLPGGVILIGDGEILPDGG